MDITGCSCLSGIIVHGRGRGREVGMPTANLEPDPGETLPPEGVYAVLARWDNHTMPAVTNVGRRPSVDDCSDITVETYIPGFSGDLYGVRMTLMFCAYLRPAVKFSSLFQVRQQVEKDVRRMYSVFRDEVI